MRKIVREGKWAIIHTDNSLYKSGLWDEVKGSIIITVYRSVKIKNILEKCSSKRLVEDNGK